MEIDKAIKHFRNCLEDNQIILDQCKAQEINPLIYANRKDYLQMAITALERQKKTGQKEPINKKCTAYGCQTKGLIYSCDWVYCPYCKTKLELEE